MTGFLRANQEKARRLPYLLIGGHAVSLHGVSRNTFDVDLLIPEQALNQWCELLSAMGFVEFFRSDAFVQFQGRGETPSVDLMVVSQETFEKLVEGAERKILDEVEVDIPSARHLVALKLHAIRQPKRKLKEKDWGDVVALIRSCGLDPENESFQALIHRYGGTEAELEIRRRLASGE